MKSRINQPPQYTAETFQDRVYLYKHTAGGTSSYAETRAFEWRRSVTPENGRICDRVIFTLREYFSVDVKLAGSCRDIEEADLPEIQDMAKRLGYSGEIKMGLAL